jgi:hypothetical protein
MSAVAALAVASPCAYVAVCDLSADIKPAPADHGFVQAAMGTDLPGEVMSAITQGLSQFGVNMPNMPSLTGSTSPALGGTGFASPGLTSPGLTSPGLTSPGLTSSPGLTGTSTPGAAPSLTDPGLTNPALSGPTGLTSPGYSSSFASPGLAAPSELPITSSGLDPGLDGTYPLYGDPSMGAGSGGLVSDVMSAAQQMGVGQLMDLLKGVAMPGITQAMQGAAAPAPAP